MCTPQVTSVAVVDDHLLFASSLEKLINSFDGFSVILKAQNGKDLAKQLEQSEKLPEIVLLDINMPVMNGFETMSYIHEKYPKMRAVALSMDDNELFILKMLKLGANGYFLKDCHPNDLERGLREVRDRGFYYSESVTEVMVNAIHDDKESVDPKFRDVELQFIKLACSELTYREIAEELNLSPKTIDGYRQDVFKRLGVRNRVGMVLWALKNKLIDLQEHGPK